MTCYFGDCREVMQRLIDEGEKVQTCVTSPPYFGLRDYQVDGQLGLEETPDEYVANMVEVFRLARELLADDGTLWLNLGDSYAQQGGRGEQGATSQRKGRSNVGAQERRDTNTRPPEGLKQKDLIGIPWRVAFALQADGWYLRQDIIWHKPNPMPESVRDRCTKAHEYIFLLSKSPKYYYDADAVKESASEDSGFAKQRAKGVNTWKYNDAPERIAQTGQRIDASTFGETGKRNRRSVWTVTTKPYPDAHFAVFPPSLIEPCILAGSRTGDVVLDPFMGSGTTAAVAEHLGRNWIGVELNPAYETMQRERLGQLSLAL